MLTKEEIDALKAHKFEPYTDEEYARHVVNPECRLRANIERVHYHNQDLSLLVDDWRSYLNGHGLKPDTSLILALTPGRGGANDARDTLGFITDFYAKNAHGSVKTWPCLIFMSKTCMTLLQHLRTLHATPHLSGAEKHIKEFINLITYEGEPILRQDEFAQKLYEAEDGFFSACERNAIALSQWIDSPKKEEEPAPPSHRYAKRKTISVRLASEITGLSESTIKRLDKDPGNSNYPGRNSSAKILAAWSEMYSQDRLMRSEVRAANRPFYSKFAEQA